MSDPIRVGAVTYLNALPLTIALRDEPSVDLVEEVPSVVADGLAEGRHDVALVPLADALRHPEWGRVPGLGIVSRGPVETVLLVSRVPFESIRRLGLDVASRTSAVLVRVLLRDGLGVEPEVIPVEPARGPVDEEAYLVIGDPAFEISGCQDGRRTLDLGAAWRDLTGKPMVYALWATRSGLDPAAVGDDRRLAGRRGGTARDPRGASASVPERGHRLSNGAGRAGGDHRVPAAGKRVSLKSHGEWS
jgi:predicted solute-binding protein